MLESCGALIEDDHFVYASGEHGPGWIAKDIVNMDPTRPRDLGAMLAEAVRESKIEFDLVCGPAIGGVIGFVFGAILAFCLIPSNCHISCWAWFPG